MIKVISDEKDDFDSIADRAYQKLALSGEAYVELVLMNESEIHTLNLSTRGIDRATDVLSYPNLDKIMPFTKENYGYDYDEENKAVFLGSIVICDAIARRQAEEYGHSVSRERAYLFLHGLLHLLGYDHEQDEDRLKMRTAEEDILTSLGVMR